MAQALGAHLLHEEPGLTVLDSPGRFRFCLVTWHGEDERPPPALVEGTGPSVAGQLCLDIPAAHFNQECTFWAALTGWPLRDGPFADFAALRRPPGGPFRLLFQRRRRSVPSDPVTAHLDLACGNARDAVTGAHVRLGARITARFPTWTSLIDPVGRPYCLISRDPVTGRVPGIDPEDLPAPDEL